VFAWLWAPTAEGLLYEVDFRLRPSGNKGPIAVRLEAFDDYQINEAWTWEHMALTRARVVAGPESFATRVDASIQAVLARPCAKMRVREDVLAMRRLLEKEKKANGVWDIKYVAGGQVDIEFIAQFLLLIHGATHPLGHVASTALALRRLADEGLLDPAGARDLIEATTLFQDVTQFSRLAVDADFDPAKAPSALRDLLSWTMKHQNIQQVEAHLARTQMRVRALFRALVGE
jgi:glutamate-ammonia-ligase adenylyltransferase